ncbi:hypothetical protein CR513_03983, partial [Mucuna pruriens]
MALWTGSPIHIQLDINNYFLNCNLFEEIQPWFVDFINLFMAYTKLCNNGFTKKISSLIYHGFKQFKCDYSLFTLGVGNSSVVVLVYVDDIIIAHLNKVVLLQVRNLLQTCFKLKVIGDLKYFLGLILVFLASKPLTFPMDLGTKLTIFDGQPLEDAFKYRRLIWHLMYLMISRSNITYIIHKL